MKDAYIAYARFIVVLAVALVLVLPFSSFLAHQDIKDSLSDYYHSETGWHRDFFIGVLCAIAVFLVLDRGLQRQANDKILWNESTLLNVAGGAALGVAFFPVPDNGPALLSPHTLFA